MKNFAIASTSSARKEICLTLAIVHSSSVAGSLFCWRLAEPQREHPKRYRVCYGQNQRNRLPKR
jgi:hypothetical protein